MKTQPDQFKKKSFLRKVGRIGVLLGIKESYLFCRNVLGLGMHPYRTLRVMLREKDRSQQVLVLGLPFYVLVGGVIGIMGGRWLIGAPAEWGLMARTMSLMVLMVAGGIGGYLFYWLIKLWRLR